MRKTICIGIPCFHGVDYQVLEDYMRLAFHLGRRHIDYNFQLAIKGKSEQFRARNAIVKAALQNSADFILMLDDDHLIDIGKSNNPSTAYDMPIKLAKLLEKSPDIGIVGALYYQRGGDCFPVIMEENKDGEPHFLHNCEISGRLQKVDVTGGGCMMIRKEVFDRIDEPWFSPEYEYGTDIQICKAARAKGFQVWCDTSIEIGHLRLEKEVITSKKIGGQFVGVVP
jgi:hypothetical protein